jgi:hypothetical protein
MKLFRRLLLVLSVSKFAEPLPNKREKYGQDIDRRVCS